VLDDIRRADTLDRRSYFSGIPLSVVIRRRRVLAAVGLGLAGCQSPRESDDQTESSSIPTTEPAPGRYWYPRTRATGNCALDDVGNIRDATPVTLPIEKPTWLVGLRTNVTGIALEGGVAVAAGTADGVRVWQG
jgi:hypothetical protein